MAREDRFANVFSAEVTQLTINTSQWVEMNFGITLRDRIAIAIDELYWYPDAAALIEMTTESDRINLAIATSDQPTNFSTDDRRILHTISLLRRDFGTAASAAFMLTPFKSAFFPPMISLPNRLFFGMNTVGLASVATVRLRMHYRTVPITKDEQLIEVLESFQLST